MNSLQLESKNPFPRPGCEARIQGSQIIISPLREGIQRLARSALLLGSILSIWPIGGRNLRAPKPSDAHHP